MKNVPLKKITLLFISTIVFIVAYLTINVDLSIFDFVMSIRLPKLIGIIIAATCIGIASIVFQAIVRNRIITPSLLGMNALYILIHTSVAFFLGVQSKIFLNDNYVFIIDIVLMTFICTSIYSYLFDKTKSNLLFILLIGTVLTTLFTSLSNTLTRLMDPNLYDTLLTTLVPSFETIRTEQIFISIVLLVLVLLVSYKDLKKLDVLTLGKEVSINLGVNYNLTTRRLMILVTFLITIATSLVGPIAFLSLIVTNIAREALGTYKHKFLIVGTVLVGIRLLLFCQIIIEHLLNYGIQVSVLVNLIGGVYFLYLILRNKGLN